MTEDRNQKGCLATIILQGHFIALWKKLDILPSQHGRNVYRAHLPCHKAGQIRVKLELREKQIDNRDNIEIEVGAILGPD